MAREVMRQLPALGVNRSRLGGVLKLFLGDWGRLAINERSQKARDKAACAAVEEPRFGQQCQHVIVAARVWRRIPSCKRPCRVTVKVGKCLYLLTLLRCAWQTMSCRQSAAAVKFHQQLVL